MTLLEIMSKVRHGFSSAVKRGQQDKGIWGFFPPFLYFSSSFSKAKRAMHSGWYLTASQWHRSKAGSSAFNVTFP